MSLENARNACVKVSIRGRPETHKFNREAAIRCAKSCIQDKYHTLIKWNELFCEEPVDKLYDCILIKKKLEFVKVKYKTIQFVDAKRQVLERKCNEANEVTEIDHGSGFIIQKHFVATSYHVVLDSLDGNNTIDISNSIINTELPCTVIYYDPGMDLALLHCPTLPTQSNGVHPLEVSDEEQLAPCEVWCCGYPNTYMGGAALVLPGYVSGSEERFARPPLMVLSCTGLNHGTSGGPVLSLNGNMVKVIGVTKEKHIKQCLEPEHELRIARIEQEYNIFERESDVSSSTQTDVNLCVLKVKRQLEEALQRGLANAVKGCTLQQFLKDASSYYQGEHKEELNGQSKTFLDFSANCVLV